MSSSAEWAAREPLGRHSRGPAPGYRHRPFAAQSVLAVGATLNNLAGSSVWGNQWLPLLRYTDAGGATQQAAVRQWPGPPPSHPHATWFSRTTPSRPRPPPYALTASHVTRHTSHVARCILGPSTPPFLQTSPPHAPDKHIPCATSQLWVVGNERGTDDAWAGLLAGGAALRLALASPPSACPPLSSNAASLQVRCACHKLDATGVPLLSSWSAGGTCRGGRLRQAVKHGRAPFRI